MLCDVSTDDGDEEIEDQRETTVWHQQQEEAKLLNALKGKREIRRWK